MLMQPEPALGQGQLLHQIRLLREQLGIEQRMSARHDYRGWSDAPYRSGALRRWYRLLRLQIGDVRQLALPLLMST